MQQDKISEQSHFVTLTYNNDFIPIQENGYKTLHTADLQNFFKRLRKYHHERFKSNAEQLHKSGKRFTPIRYYAVGEYGSRNWRPHYHVILFNAEIADIISAWSLGGRAIGDVHIGKVEAASIGYCLKYISKSKRVPAHRNDTRMPERSFMSKGLGANYLSDQMLNWHNSHGSRGIYCTIEGGRKISMPRYYRTKIGYSEEVLEEFGYSSKIRKDIDRERIIRRIGIERFEANRKAYEAWAERELKKTDTTKKL